MRVSQCQTTEDFLAKLDKIEFTSADRHNKTLEGNFLGNKVRVSYNLNIDSYGLGNGDYPIQVVMRVRINGKYASSWGCCANDDNCKCLQWFFKKESETSKNERKEERELEDRAVALMDLM
tara:strand:+ start:151 stop:513 length:363 start_codon:yes stop_codon:yes gene_type:complete